MAKPLQCSKCGKAFANINNFHQHSAEVHKGKAKAVPRPPRPEREESIAERAIQAELDVSMGIPTADEWLVQ
jgi:hypothetical protein